MSVAELDEHRTTATERLIEVALRLERDEDVDHWELADTTLEAVEERLGNAVDGVSSRQGQTTGIYAVLDEIRSELQEAGAANVAAKRTLRNAYSTAATWPLEDRVEGANYWAHYELAGAKWTNRKRILQRLVDDRRKQGGKGLIGTPQVRLRKSDETKPDLRPRDEKLDASIRSAVHRWASPQEFSRLASEEQDMALKVIEQVAREMRAGEFE